MKKLLCVLILLGGVFAIPKEKNKGEPSKKDNTSMLRNKCEGPDCWGN